MSASLRISRSNVLSARNWEQARLDYEVDVPCHYMVLDDFLEKATCESLRQGLLNHWGWRRKNWVSEQLYNARPNMPEIAEITEELKVNAPWLLSDLELVSHWALLYPSNAGLQAHADAGVVQVSLWLTPDEYNLEPDAGGLVLFDTKRTPDMLIHEYSAPPQCVEYHERTTKGEMLAIGYRYNRAVIFDATAFHASDRVRFLARSTESYRMNLALSFDDVVTYKESMEPYQNGAKPQKLSE